MDKQEQQSLEELRDALKLTLQFIDECGTWHTRQETAEKVEQARKSLRFLIRWFMPSDYTPLETT